MELQEVAPLLRLVTDIHQGVVRLFNHRARDLGLTRTHWEVISNLYREPGLTQTGLAHLIAMGRSPLGKAIDRLESVGLVERRPDDHDRRVNRLYLTDQAADIVKPASEIREQIEQTLIGALAGSEIDEVHTYLSTLRENLNRQLDEEHGVSA